jgi:iron complex outermembrane recepter protein
MSTNHCVKRAVRSALSEALWTSAGPLNRALLLVAASAFAQTAIADPQAAQSQQVAQASAAAADEKKDEPEEVVIVGSRIRRDTFDSPSPVQVITREESTQAGFVSATDILQGTGVTTGAAQINNAFGGFVTNGGPGANTISLRGLGAGRTLVLINGRRVAPAGVRGAVGSADLNVLPTSIIDRIEVLRDGASSIYGSDAIAGVINVVTMKQPDGITFEGQYNAPTEGEGDQGRGSVVGGLSGDGWSFSGSYEYYRRGNLALGDRDWALCNTDSRRNPATGVSTDFIDPLTGQPKCYPITGTGSNGVTINTIGTQNVTAANFAALGLNGPVVGAPGSAGTTFNRFRPNSAVNTGVIGFEGVGGGANNINVRDTFDPRTLNRSLISPAQVQTLFLQGSFDVNALGDAEFYVEFLGNDRKSQFTGYRQLSLDYRQGTTVIPNNLAFSVFGVDQGTSGGQNVGVRAFIGFGNDRSEVDVNYYKPLAGLRGELPFLGDWRYDVYGSHAVSEGQFRQQSFLTDKVTFASDVVAAPATIDRALVIGDRAGAPVTCRINLTNTAERCVPFPLLNSQTIGGVLPTSFVNYIFRDVVGQTDFDESTVSAVFDGSVIDLPAGKLRAVVGFEYRHQEIDDTPDINSINNNLYNLTSSAPTRGTDSVKEAYTEISVPILSNILLVNELTFNGSFRYTDYQSFGSDETYKVGLQYSPINWMSLRINKGTSFRAPALFEQFQGATSGFLSQTNDPCNNFGGAGVNPFVAANCAAELGAAGNMGLFQATQGIRVLSVGGAAAGLAAETSDNLTYGIILQPPTGDLVDIALAVDYFNIDIDNGVAQAGAGNILALCYQDPDFRAGGGFCNLVTRNPNTTALTVNNAYTNIATQVAHGIDVTLRVEGKVGPGRLRLNAQMTQYSTQASKLFATDELDEINGTVGVPARTGTASLTYSYDNWQFRYGVEWIAHTQSYDDIGLDPATSVFDLATEDYYEHGVSVRYTGDDVEATLGVRNLANAEPPTISSGFFNRVGNAPLYSGYDYVGREVFLQFAKKF